MLPGEKHPGQCLQQNNKKTGYHSKITLFSPFFYFFDAPKCPYSPGNRAGQYLYTPENTNSRAVFSKNSPAVKGEQKRVALPFMGRIIITKKSPERNGAGSGQGQGIKKLDNYTINCVICCVRSYTYTYTYTYT